MSLESIYFPHIARVNRLGKLVTITLSIEGEADRDCKK